MHAIDRGLLNGRWPGDTPGIHTCHSAAHSARTDARGRTVIDYTIIAFSLYACVQHFNVDLMNPVLSWDHSASCIHQSLHMQNQCFMVGEIPSHIRPRVDAQVDAYLDELQLHQDHFATLLADMPC